MTGHRRCQSDRPARAILWAMSMHPDDRPTSIAQFSDALFGSGELPPLTFGAGLRRADLVTMKQQVLDDELSQGNLALAILAAVLLGLALVVTLFSPLM